MFWIGLLVGWASGPILVVAVLFLMRDILPPTLFTPSDWEK